MLEFVAGSVAALLIVAGVLVLAGPSVPRRLLARLRTVKRPAPPSALFRTRVPTEPMTNPLHPKTQRVMIAASRLATWLRAHGHDDLVDEIRSSARRMAGDEAAGLYALQTVLRRLRALPLDDRAAQERLRHLSSELRSAVHDRSEQLELLPRS
jgi:hypothetical protein